MAEEFGRQEVDHIRDALASGAEAACPRCGGRFDRTEVPQRDDVPYVRERVWLICTACDTGLVLDRRKAPPR